MARSNNSGEEIDEGLPAAGFFRGDHVYQWCSVLGIPKIFAHHGIVTDLHFDATTRKWSLSVADFDNWYIATDGKEPTAKRPVFSSSRSSSKSLGKPDPDDDGAANIRVYRTDPHQWQAVKYGVRDWKERLFSRGGSVTGAQSDSPGIVLARVEFLLKNPHCLPPYDVVKSNCECVAVWCRTGTWATLQASQILMTATADQTKTAVFVAAGAATTQVTVPAAGLWGMAGYTTQVSLLSTQPWLLPTIIAGGAIRAGLPALWLAFARKYWGQVTKGLNTAFWESVEGRPDIIVELIQYYNPNLCCKA